MTKASTSRPTPLLPNGWITAPTTPTVAMLQGACSKHAPGQPMSESHPEECPRFVARRRIYKDMIAHIGAGDAHQPATPIDPTALSADAIAFGRAARTAKPSAGTTCNGPETGFETVWRPRLAGHFVSWPGSPYKTREEAIAAATAYQAACRANPRLV